MRTMFSGQCGGCDKAASLLARDCALWWVYPVFMYAIYTIMVLQTTYRLHPNTRVTPAGLLCHTDEAIIYKPSC